MKPAPYRRKLATVSTRIAARSGLHLILVVISLLWLLPSVHTATRHLTIVAVSWVLGLRIIRPKRRVATPKAA